jgi:hypothetical protein
MECKHAKTVITLQDKSVKYIQELLDTLDQSVNGTKVSNKSSRIEKYTK